MEDFGALKTHLNGKSFSWYEYKTVKEFQKFDAEIEKQRFHSSKRAMPIGNANINKIVTFEEFP